MATPEHDPVPTRDSSPLAVSAVSLEGVHVRLVPLSLEHVPGLSALLEPEIFEYFPMVLRTHADVETYVDAALKATAAGTELPFVILERDTGTPVGTTRYMDIRREHRTLEIGHTWHARRVWRSRVNTECKYLLLRHAFEMLRVMRVQFKTDRRNTRSRTAIERLGARFEGILRHHMLVRGDRVRDSAFYSIVDTEWPEVRTGLERKLEGTVP